MNYRHIYHAGNHADVLKHAVLALIIEHLKGKEAGFRVIDTHAGTGSYDLGREEAQKTGEWLGGIGRLIGPNAKPMPDDIAELLAPYLRAVRAWNPPDMLTRYPGSPRVARALMRPQDTLVVNELHPQDAVALRRAFANDAQTKALMLDGWTAVKALLPPKERRGVVLIDPPFEEPGENVRMADALADAVKRFATGIYMLWYPIKDRAAVRGLERRLEAAGVPKLLQVELEVRALAHGEAERLTGSGLIICNPPYRLDVALERLIPWLADRLAVAERSGRCVVKALR